MFIFLNLIEVRTVLGPRADHNDILRQRKEVNTRDERRSTEVRVRMTGVSTSSPVSVGVLG